MFLKFSLIIIMIIIHNYYDRKTDVGVFSIKNVPVMTNACSVVKVAITHCAKTHVLRNMSQAQNTV